MKKTVTFYVKTIMAVLGGLLILLSSTFPVLVEITSDYGYSGLKHVKHVSALESPLWYSIILSAVIVFAIGYFFNKTVNVVLTFVFTPVFLLGIGFFTFISTFRLSLFGPSVSIHLGDGYKLAIYGYLLIVIATCISVLRKKNKVTTNTSMDLLDEI